MKKLPLKTVILRLVLSLLNECLCGLEFDGVCRSLIFRETRTGAMG